jgi:phage tail-like protein
MGLPDFDTSVGWSFGLEIDGVAISQIQEVSGLTIEQDSIELKENTPDGKYVNQVMPGRPKTAEVTLTRGLKQDDTFEKWIKDSFKGDLGAARKGGAIIVFDHMGAPLKRYKLTNAWPTKLEIGSMKSGDTSVLTEKLTLKVDRIDPE